MGSGQERNSSKKKKNKGKPLGPKTTNLKPKNNINNNKQPQSDDQLEDQTHIETGNLQSKLSLFLDKFQSANRLQLSSLELDSLTDKCIVDFPGSTDQDVENLGKQVKAAFGPSWKDELCDKRLLEGKVGPGSPAVLIISTSALRSIELLRGFRSLTKECHAAKLFSKHMKVEEQVSLLKDRVNIASGTPNRIKKLIDTEALGLSRLSVIVLDVHPDVKGYSLLTLPQVRDEFWDLYKTYFHQRLQGSLRLSLYGPLVSDNEFKGKKKRPNE
ncbi:protein CMS1 [Argentina anserina]|uniref:protein CMS1 n=1 Tax=Argentina anserina TaxID=57926 RepID=UPI0021765EA9|nr:protein CMS1 [Potentilla anserina]